MNEQPDDLWMVERLLAGDPQDDGALAALVAAATAPGTPDELAGEEAFVAAFSRASRGLSPSTSLPTRARRLPVLSTLLAGKVVAAAAAGGIAIAGTAAAAYTGNLPDALQDVAHQAIGAPAAQGSDAADEHRPETPAASPTGRPATASPVGPDASGAAAHGLCTAWDKGGLSTKSVAYEALVKAAGEESKIEEFCASVEKPGKSGDHTPATPTQRATGAPETRPTGAPETRPTTPEARPTGAPETRPAGAPAKPTGK